MLGVYDAIRVFVLEHRGCGELRDDAEPITPEGDEIWLSELQRRGEVCAEWSRRRMLKRIRCGGAPPGDAAALGTRAVSGLAPRAAGG